MAKGAAVKKKYYPSEDLEEILGSNKPITRGAALKAIWEYADEEGLKTQKKYKGRNMGAIKADSVLAPVIGSGVVAAPQIMKKLGEHLDDE